MPSAASGLRYVLSALPLVSENVERGKSLPPDFLDNMASLTAWEVIHHPTLHGFIRSLRYLYMLHIADLLRFIIDITNLFINFILTGHLRRRSKLTSPSTSANSERSKHQREDALKVEGMVVVMGQNAHNQGGAAQSHTAASGSPWPRWGCRRKGRRTAQVGLPPLVLLPAILMVG